MSTYECLYHKAWHERPVHCAVCAEPLVDLRRKYCPPPKPCQDTYAQEHWAWGYTRARFLKPLLCDCIPTEMGQHVHCQECGAAAPRRDHQGLTIEVHHVHEVNGGPRQGLVNRPENLLALCPTCHHQAHHPAMTKLIQRWGRLYPTGRSSLYIHPAQSRLL